MTVSTLIFDWGDTLMINYPGQAGPMADWPQVSAVEGVEDALEKLRDNYQLVLATNAPDSRSHQVRKALARVGLDGYFNAIFTAAELGARKPHQAFFQAVQSVLGKPAGQLLMLGDDYRVDILGAKSAGWQAAWYNPRSQAAPGLLPLHDVDLISWECLKPALEAPPLPGYAQCIAWLLSRPFSANLLAHVHAVASAAYLLALWLRSAGLPVCPLLTHRGGLLHDLAKLEALQRPAEHRIGHGELAARILTDIGQPALAEIARRHPLFAIDRPDTAPRTWEQKLVYLADKLVEGSRLEGLEERVDSLRRRYPLDDSRIAATLPALLAMRDEICAAAGLSTAEFEGQLKSAFSTASTG